MKQGRQEEAEMEMLLMEIPHAAPPLVQSQQQRPVGERYLEVEQQEERFHRYISDPLEDDGVVRVGGYAHRGYASASPIQEDTDGMSSPFLGSNAAAEGVSRLFLATPMEGEGVYHCHIPGYGMSDAWNAFSEEQQEELRLLGRLSSIRIGKEKDVNNPVDPYGIWSPRGAVASGDAILDNPPLIPYDPVAFPDQEKVSLVPQQRRHPASSKLQAYRSSLLQQDAPLSHGDSLCSVPINLLNNDDVWSDLQHYQNSSLGGDPYERAIRVMDAFCTGRIEVVDDFLASEQKSPDSSDHWDASTPPISPQTVLPTSQSGLSVLTQQKGLSTSSCKFQYVTPVGIPEGVSAFTYEDSFIIQGQELRCMASNNGHGLQKERVRSHMDAKWSSKGNPLVTMDHLQSPRPHCLSHPMPKYQSLVDIQGSISLVAKDQHGCRFLQRKFDEGTGQEKEMIFNEIIHLVPELMVNPFGNYLMQKILGACTEEQRLKIILALTKIPTELVRISLNMHGTRAVQKLIEVLQNKKETSLVISALKPGFLNLVTDSNGNHVIQRCLQYFNCEQNKFIFDAAARHCVDIATHRHGCCVLQRCIAHSTGRHQMKLLAEVSRNGLILAQDAYGNYAVQYILDMKNPLAIDNLKSEFKGNYVQLSMQKFSSNVVEKCLCAFDEAGRRMIISELLSVPCFDHLMQDPYANYVIQSALLVCKGHVRASLVDAIRPHAFLRANPYCKGIFNLLKK